MLHSEKQGVESYVDKIAMKIELSIDEYESRSVWSNTLICDLHPWVFHPGSLPLREWWWIDDLMMVMTSRLMIVRKVLFLGVDREASLRGEESVD